MSGDSDLSIMQYQQKNMQHIHHTIMQNAQKSKQNTASHNDPAYY